MVVLPPNSQQSYSTKQDLLLFCSFHQGVSWLNPNQFLLSMVDIGNQCQIGYRSSRSNRVFFLSLFSAFLDLKKNSPIQ